MVRQLFEGATYSVLGDRASTFFWTDRWLPEGRLVDIAPNLTAAVPKRAVRQRRVREGLAGGWLDDLPPDLGAPAIRELFEVADRLVDIAFMRVWRMPLDGVGRMTTPTQRGRAIERCLELGWKC